MICTVRETVGVPAVVVTVTVPVRLVAAGLAATRRDTAPLDVPVVKLAPLPSTARIQSGVATAQDVSDATSSASVVPVAATFGHSPGARPSAGAVGVAGGLAVTVYSSTELPG